MSNVAVDRYRFTADEYHRMAQAGVFGEDDRIELIEGEIVRMVPIGGSHVFLVNRLNNRLVRCAGDSAVVSVQNPVRLSEQSEPEPDFVLLDPLRIMPFAVPTVDAALLVIEVADSSIDYDRQVKACLYGAAGVPEYWLVDVQRRGIECYREPSTAGYRQTRLYLAGETLVSERLPDCSLAVDWLFADF